MAIKSSDQISIVDVTDAYSVTLTSEAHTFPGSTSAAKAGSTTTQVNAMLGASQVAASVVVSEITGVPTGMTASVDTDATAPTITFTVTTSMKTASGSVTIPVHIGDVTITKQFDYAIAFTGATGSTGTAGSVWYTGTAITGTSTTATIFSGSNITAAKVNDQYLNTSTGYTYKCTTAGAASAAKWVYTGSIKGATGATGTAGSVWYSGTDITGTSTTDAVFSGSGITAAKVADQYLNTSTGNTYKCTVAGAASAAKWVYTGNIKGATGATGAAGAAAITISITSSNGTIFKNTSISTVLTAHVYQAGAEVTGDALTKLGTIKWYKDGGSTAVASGQTLTISAGDVTNKATYVAQLEG
jgi:hypothetical protein